MAVLPRTCEQARSWVSLDLDGELSEFESVMLRAHVARCGACATFQADAVAFTSRLRHASLEAMPAPVVLPSRRRSATGLVRVGTAAAVALIATGAGMLLSTVPGPESLTAPVSGPTREQLMSAYLDAPQGLPQRPPIAFRARVGLDPGRDQL